MFQKMANPSPRMVNDGGGGNGCGSGNDFKIVTNHKQSCDYFRRTFFRPVITTHRNIRSDSNRTEPLCRVSRKSTTHHLTFMMSYDSTATLLRFFTTIFSVGVVLFAVLHCCSGSRHHHNSQYDKPPTLPKSYVSPNLRHFNQSTFFVNMSHFSSESYDNNNNDDNSHLVTVASLNEISETFDDIQAGSEYSHSHSHPHSHHHHHNHHNSRHKLKHHRKRNNGDFRSENLDSVTGSGGANVAPSLSSATSHLTRTYITTNKSINFTHVELDPVTGNVYVGASNWIYQLNADTLRVEHAVRTGPIRDSVACAPADCSGVDSNVVQVSNNVNKVLLLEPYARMLIVCGSVHQGACARHRLEDISLHEELIPLPVASNDENSSTIAFVGPARYFGVQLTPILYVAATDSRLGPYRDMVPAISGRSLESGSKLFNIIERSFADSARIDISSHLRDYFLVRYVYGFYSGDYVYFAQVQRRSYLRALEESGYVTRLARVCVSDAGFHTYTEMTLECVNEAGSRTANFRSTSNSDRGQRRWQSGNKPHQTGPDSQQPPGDQPTEEFNLLQDAYLIKAGADLADSLHIERGAQVLVGVFSASFDHTLRPGSKSALCMFPMAEIEQRFAENIHLCYNGSVYSRNMDYIAGSVNQCPDQGTGNVFNFCNEAVKLNGSIAARAQAAIVYRGGTVLTAVTAAITGQHTVAFLGTSYGSVKKILLQRGDYGEQFDEVLVDSGHPILSDLFVDSDHNPKHLIAASPYKVVKLPVESCGQSDSCDQCLQARNPYCGWCSLQKRCTIKSECLNQPVAAASTTTGNTGSGFGHHHYSAPGHRSHSLHSHHHASTSSSASGSGGGGTSSALFSTPRWLSLETAQCIDFQAIKPEFMPRDLLAPVELIINQLPPLPYGANYLCVFERSSPIPGTVTRNGLTCQTPSPISRPTIPNGQDHVNVNLAVRSSETDTDFIHRSFIFFDCSVHKSCKSCVMSSWNCNWCMHENLCSYNTSQCTRRVIVGENSPQNSLIKGVQHCPSFSIEQEILIPNGARREIRVEVRNLIPSQDGFQCIIEIEQAKERIPARIRDNNIICQEIPISYQDEIGRQNASLTVLWNGDTFIDQTNFTIYKCQYLGSHAGRADCSLCQTLESKYGCVWCLNQCAFVDQCSETPVSSCPPPRIDYIHPISGPVEGGTLVSIEGSNLGASMEEIQDSVSIGGIPCHPIEYNVSIRVICRTGPSPIGPQSALVVIGNRAGVTRAQEKFQYKTIELNDVSPKIGPQSGGSRIYLSGNNLNIGSNVALYLDNLPCHVERALASSSQLSCRTTAAPYPSYVVSRLLLSIDGSNYTLLNPFLYTSDPTIVRIEPLQSFFSGGRYLYVTGSQFTSIQQPRLLVFARRSRSQAQQQQQQHGRGVGGGFPTVWPPYATRTMSSVPGGRSVNGDTGSHQLIDSQRLINDSICTVLSPIKMVCPTPMINHDLRTLAIKLRQSQDRSTISGNQSSTAMSSPSVPIHIPDQLYLQVGFSMDDTVSVLELDTYYPHLDSNILYVSDPVVYSLSNGHGKSISANRIGIREGDDVLPFKGDSLIVEGENLAILPLADTELNVTVGLQRCNLTSVSMRQIVCQPPPIPPAPTDELGRRSPIELPAVILKIGNMRRLLGYLHYGELHYVAGFAGYGPNNNPGSNGHGYRFPDTDSDMGYGNNNNNDREDDTSRFYHQNHPSFGYGNRFDSVNGVGSPGGNNSGTIINLELLIGMLILTGTILAIISVIVLAAYRHKTTEAEREFKRIQLQMDTLENNVRSECKQAFAELQTDILQASGLFSLEELHRMVVPTHDDRTFLLRMFFNNGQLTTQDGDSGQSGSSYYLAKDYCHSIYDQGSIYRPLVYGQLSNQVGRNPSNFYQTTTLQLRHLSQLFWSYSPYFGLTNEQSMIGSNHFVLPSIGGELSASNTYQQIGLNNENYYTLSRSSIVQEQSSSSPNSRLGYNPMMIIYHQPQSPTAPSIHQNIYGGIDGAHAAAGGNNNVNTKPLIEQFEQLLLNRSFLLNLIETLEQQKSFSIGDRTKFASLLMLALLDRMEYSFDIMRELLARLIDRLATGKHPNQLMRRPETVGEKMLVDWLSICLCRYAKEVSGGPLFLLFSAIKHQIDKGPVDFVTGNSRYSLSEERLLREQIDYKTITVFVVVDEKLEQSLPTITVASQTNGNNKPTTMEKSNSSGSSVQQQQQRQHRQKRTSNVIKSTSTLRRAGVETNAIITPKIGSSEIGPDGSMVTAGTGTTDELTMTDGTSSAELTDKEFEQDYGAGVGGVGAGSGSISGSGLSTINCFQCRVLDCDTISQVKAKIIDTLYRAVPHSERPSIGDIQLYWRCLKPKPANGSSITALATTADLAAKTAEDKLEGPIISIKPPPPTFPPSMATASLLQEVYGVASMMSKADADRIYNASRRSDMSLLEVADLLLEDYDHSTQILTANEAIWRRLNTIAHYGIPDGAQLLIGLCVPYSLDLAPASAAAVSGGHPAQCSTLYGKRPHQTTFSQDNLTVQPTMNEVASGSGNGITVNPRLASGPGLLRFNFIPNGPNSGLNHYEDNERQVVNVEDNEEDDDDDDDENNEESNFHLYESIPAALNHRHQGSGQAPSENYSMTTGSRDQSMIYSSNGMEAVYNLSNASSAQIQNRTSRSNFYHVGSNLTMMGQRNHYGMAALHHPQQQDQLGQTAAPPPLPPLSQFNQPQQQHSPFHDLTSVYNRAQSSNSSSRPEELYGGVGARIALGPCTSPLSTSVLPVQSPNNNNNNTLHNYSQQRLLWQHSRQCSSPSVSGPSTTYRIQNTDNSRGGNVNSRGSGSMARNFYERLSSLVRGRRRQKGRSSSWYNGLHATGNKHRPAQHRSGSNDYGWEEDDENNVEEDDDFEERHNIWHLVKPSSLIADCIIGASGSFLYDDPADMINGGRIGNGRDTRRNLRTIRQRRALRRRCNNGGTGSAASRKPFVKQSSSPSRQMASAAAAAAALSASQINLNQSININNNNPSTIAMSFHSSSIPNGHHSYQQHPVPVPGPGSLSFLTSSASSLFASLFTNQNNNNSNSPNSTQQRNSTALSSGSNILLHKSIPEIYLTRLLSTKGTIQQYVDDFFGTIFTVDERLPIAVKWLFDFFDNVAMKNSINDSDIVHLWKSNSFVLRFWITLLRSPEMLFDVGSNVSIDVCLDVLANNLTEACLATGSGMSGTSGAGLESSNLSSPSHHHNHNLSKESPSSKLLFARDIPAYQQMIGQYYKDIAMLPSIKESDIMAYMKDVSKNYEGKVRKERTITELLSYCLVHKDAIFSSLATDAVTQQEHLHLRFESIAYAALAANSQNLQNLQSQPQPQSQYQSQPQHNTQQSYTMRTTTTTTLVPPHSASGPNHLYNGSRV